MNKTDAVCQLCGNRITGYKPEWNRVTLSPSLSANLCISCIDRIVLWKQERFAKLFPTKQAKRYVKMRKR